MTDQYYRSPVLFGGDTNDADAAIEDWLVAMTFNYWRWLNIINVCVWLCIDSDGIIDGNVMTDHDGYNRSSIVMTYLFSNLIIDGYCGCSYSRQ